jgi:hypothetical protein
MHYLDQIADPYTRTATHRAAIAISAAHAWHRWCLTHGQSRIDPEKFAALIVMQLPPVYVESIK